MTAQQFTIEVLPRRLQLLIVTRHEGHVVDGIRGQFLFPCQVLFDERAHYLLRRLRARYVGEDEGAVRFFRIADPTCPKG